MIFKVGVGIIIMGLLLLSAASQAMTSDHSHAMKDDHAKHKASLGNKKIQRHFVNYQFENVTLTRADGVDAATRNIFAVDRPVVLNFIFTTCATICPVLSATFSQLQNDLNELNQVPDMVSISIDPEQDTPARLRDYGKKFNALPLWTFYTGSRSDIEGLQRSFDIFRGNKVNHIPVTFIRAAHSDRWLRIDGFISKKHLLSEYKALVGM